jgi:hypothetical protein
MTIPLDRLYNYINDSTRRLRGDNVVIYRFFPHGSKKISDLSMVVDQPSSYCWSNLRVEVFCNDQEPLNYYLYDNQGEHLDGNKEYLEIFNQHNITFPSYNFRGPIKTIWDQALLIHSEKRSEQLELYKNCQFIPIYYWSHAVIARDWFRYAEHVGQKKQSKKTFLIYNRAWSGTREYRLKFTELLIRNQLEKICQTTITPIEPQLDIHYSQHKFNNSAWKPASQLENYIPPNTVTSCYSADFDIVDYESTDIEVVLETLFDDTRLHLTEKSLRPIACAQPFILVGTWGSLEYLRSYGFKTFDSVWDENYDQILDPVERMNAIIMLMTHIAGWDLQTKQIKLQQALAIAEYNKSLFFSNNFFNLVINELNTNLKLGFEELEATNKAEAWFRRREINYANPELLTHLKKIRNQEDADFVLQQAEKYYKK